MPVPSRADHLASLSYTFGDAFADKRARYSGSPFDAPAGFTGNHLFVQTCGCCSSHIGLVEVEEVEYYVNRYGFSRLARLSGEVVWGEVGWQRVNIDRRARYEELGWKPLETFRDYHLGMEGTEYQFLVCELEYRILETNGYRLICPTQIEGYDLITGANIDEKVKGDKAPSCVHFAQERCTGWFCAEPCREVRSEEGEVLDDCDCRNELGCIWMTWHGCIDKSCAGRCIKRFGIFGISCECAKYTR